MATGWWHATMRGVGSEYSIGYFGTRQAATDALRRAANGIPGAVKRIGKSRELVFEPTPGLQLDKPL